MTKTVEQATAALEAANSSYLGELQRDCERSEGSGAQERRREEHQQSLRDDVAKCERDLEEAKRLEKFMWKIHAGGRPIFTGTEDACRRIFNGYKEWRVWQGEPSSIPLQAEVGSDPATWTLPVVLIDSSGTQKESMGQDPN